MGFLLSTLDDVFGNSVVAQEFDPEKFADLIRSTTALTKGELPLYVGARLGTLRTPIGPNGKGGNSLRHDANVLGITAISIDYDGEQMTLQDAVARADAVDVAYIAYNSPSHRPGHDRWRFVFPLSQEAHPGEKLLLTNIGNGILAGVASRESWPLSQGFYYGHVDGTPFEVVVGDSERCIDEADLSNIAIPFQPPPGSTKGAKPDFDRMTEQELLEVIQSGAHYWSPAKRVLTMWARQGMSTADAESNLAAAFDAVPVADRGKKWTKNKIRIPIWVKDCYERALRKKPSAAFLALVTKLEEEEHWKGALRTNAFTEVVEICQPFPPKPGQVSTVYRPMRDEDGLEALSYWQGNGLPNAKKGTVWDALMLVASRNPFHPVREVLQGDEWDGGEKVGRLFIDYFPAWLPDRDEDPEDHDEMVAFLERVAECFMVGAVARIYDPGCKLDCLPVLVSPQNYNKSRGLAALVPDPRWFSDELPANVWERDSKEALQGRWIVELAEFPHIRKEVEKTKAFFSRQVDRYRRAYGRSTTDHPRQCVFCATTNELTFLDVTGNRRYWPVQLAAPANVEAIIADRAQLWAEAVHLYHQGFQWWLPPSLEAIAEQLQNFFIEPDEWDEPIMEWLDREHPKVSGKRTPFTLKALLRGLGFHQPRGAPGAATKADEMRAARRLRALGFQRDQQRHRGTGRVPTWSAIPKHNREV
jgi:predicted P-loop ATPase